MTPNVKIEVVVELRSDMPDAAVAHVFSAIRAAVSPCAEATIDFTSTVSDHLSWDNLSL